MRKIMWIISLMFLLAFVSPVSAENPYAASNDSWISLNGNIVTADNDSFELDYGEGIVIVEMDDWDWYDDAYGVLTGDEVTVYGYVDDDFLETTSIEASGVYVKNRNTYYYASGADEEDRYVPYYSTAYVDTDLQLTGKVTSTSGREFTIDTGNRKIQVNTSAMLYNPLDDKGFQQITEGERVQVTGDLDIDLFEEKEIMAETIITLQEDKGARKEKIES